MSYGVRIKISSENIDPLLAKIRRLDGHAEEPLEIAGVEAHTIIKEKFQNQGPGWARLSERTLLKRRNADKSSVKILLDEGTLRDSITSQAGQESVYVLTGRELLIGSNLVYAAIQNFGWPSGGKHPPPTIPARPYLPTPEELIPRLEAELTAWLDDHLKGP